MPKDRQLVAYSQKHEVAYLAKKHKCEAYLAREAILTASSSGKKSRSRVKVEARLKIILDARLERL